MADVLLLSNSTMPGTSFFSWPKPWVKEFLGSVKRKLLFIPYAAVSLSYDEYEQKVIGAFSDLGFVVQSIHRFDDPLQGLERAEGIIVGGGNSFALLERMYRYNLLAAVTRKVMEGGIPFIGWSAGANLAGPTIMTTNDMPVIQPPSLRALGLVPFQINPHYHELKFEGQGGETRKERLEEFLVLNPDKKVVGLPEGTLLMQRGSALTFQGILPSKLYHHGKEPVEILPGSDVSFLMLDS